MLSIEPWAWDGAQKELGTVGVGSGVGHGQDSGTGVSELEVLIGELVSIDGLSSGSVVVGEVTSLAHEIGDDTVEAGSLVSESLLAGAQSTEVLGGLGNNIGSQLHGDSSSGLSANGDIKVNLRIGPEVKVRKTI